ncbi:MAG: SUMF1/EgtB/PvdO family nonheme iron enzyme [Deltaproteobacteria bacterium]|nr:SUMF1/EgtB/PvdO family nonheme iron enzyme [Deltaproteobacteria bacterium]
MNATARRERGRCGGAAGTYGLAALLALAGALACSRQQVSIEKEPVDAATTGASAVACPKGLAGPPLVLVPSPGSGSFCMDARETTRGEYDSFLAAKGSDGGGQAPECSWNDSFVPTLWPLDPADDNPPLYYCPPEHWNGMHADWAVDCVDFCDALAYCEWAGKRLCGRVGGPAKWGRVYIAYKTKDEYDAFVPVAKSVESEFVSACTQGGATKYPYGDQYEPARCIDSKWVEKYGADSVAVADTSSRECHGTEPPYDAIYDLSGNVGEWQNMCYYWPNVPEIGGSLLGGSRDPSDVGRQDCVGDYGKASARSVFGNVGIRCCADAVPAPGS